MIQDIQPFDRRTRRSFVGSGSAISAVLALAVVLIATSTSDQASAQGLGQSRFGRNPGLSDRNAILMKKSNPSGGFRRGSRIGNTGLIMARGTADGAARKTIPRGQGDGTGRLPGKRRLPIWPPDFGGGSGGGGSGSGIATFRRPGSGAPPANERNYVPDEVVIELAAGTTDQAAAALAQRFRLTRLESFDFQLAGTKLFRWRIADRRPVPTVIRALEVDRSVISVSPNYVMKLNGELAVTTGAPPLEQYALAKLHVLQAHALARGNKVLVAVIDGGVDASHPELTGVIADSFDAIGSGDKVHAHGTAVAGAIAAQARLRGTAPDALILAARAFGAGRDKTEGTTFHVIKAIDWAVFRGARIINMSFAGPRDPKIELALKAARAKGLVLIAAAGNAGPRSPPLYPAADPNVIAVTATDANDKLFDAANRGMHVAVAAPGVELWLPGLEGTYQETSGTSFAAAEVSGTVALLLERKPELGHDEIRRILMSTARDLGPRGIDPQFGAGLVDAYQAVLSIMPAAVDMSAAGGALGSE
jgi:hypothetical protein